MKGDSKRFGRLKLLASSCVICEKADENVFAASICDLTSESCS